MDDRAQVSESVGEPLTHPPESMRDILNKTAKAHAGNVAIASLYQSLKPGNWLPLLPLKAYVEVHGLPVLSSTVPSWPCYSGRRSSLVQLLFLLTHGLHRERS